MVGVVPKGAVSVDADAVSENSVRAEQGQLESKFAMQLPCSWI